MHALKPVALQDDSYRWTIGIYSRPSQADAARNLAAGFREGWPGRDEFLTFVWRSDVAPSRVAYEDAFASTPCDLLFVFDDPSAPDEIGTLLQAAVNARQTPIRVTDLNGRSEPASPSALSWSVEFGDIQAHAMRFAMAVFSSFMAKGLVCVDWVDLLMLLDAPGRIATITHCESASAGALIEAYVTALESITRSPASPGAVMGTHTTIINTGSLRMVDVRKIVMRTRQHFGEEVWLSYAAPEYACERLHAFLLCIA
ncbi:hypothetical protein OPU71_17430 [Niveibacterium sp. 24ML]|uniref:hypothetical protein n=1 Tax=Niveibacterium sp. 24ML TaxID=2985512 RepID=UPI0022716598|nr:hypothetical protein [Niveibacterium sp. 24ML]MCX9157909.1 hypothetical protein [Niveibacterium sp. 24ML]